MHASYAASRSVPSRSPSASISASAIGVRTQPGQTQFARTPSGPWSTAMHCVSIARPAFEAQYASDAELARRPATDEIVTIEPRRAARCSIAARAIRNAPVRFDAEDVVPRCRVEVAQRALAADARVADERVEAAEALDRRRDRALRIADVARVGDDREPADLGRDLLDRPGAPPGDGDAHTRRAASRRATAAPIPVPPPVTSATLC